VSGANANGQPDRVSFAPAEPLDKPDDPVGHSVLLLQKREDAFGGFRFNHSRLSINPLAFDGASRVTSGDANSWIVSNALYLSGVRIGANEQFPVLFDEPYRGANGVSSFPVCFDADVFLACELGQFVCGGQLRLTTVEVPLGDADGVAYTN
jgi:hypothetical protein